jgi:hypothetical protein
MAFKSEAQRKKFQELVSKGLMPQSTFDEWDAKTPDKIPDRVTKKPTKAKTHSLPKGYIKPIKAK